MTETKTEVAKSTLDLLRDLMSGEVDMSALAPPAAEPGDDTNRIYRQCLNTPAGQAMLADMLGRLVVGGTYQPGGDPAAAVYDAGVRALIAELIWRAGTKESTDD